MGFIERFEHAFLARREQRPPGGSLTFTEAGLVLGAGTFVAPMRQEGGDAAALDLSGEDRILALLAVAVSAPVDAAVLGKLRHASELWAQGDKCLAQIHLQHLRLPKLESEEQAFRLFLADRLIASGQSPRDLCRALGFDLPEGLKKYNPDEPRDDHGRWTTGGGDVASGPDLNPALTSYEFSGTAASQTSTNPDGTSIVSTWTLNRGSGLTQTDEIRLANGDIAATSVTDSKATQTLSLSEAGAKAGLVIVQPPGGDPTLIAAGTAASTGTTLLDEAGSMTHIGRWFMTGAGAGAAFYFGATTPAGPEDETTPIGAGNEFRILSNADSVGALVQRKTDDGWVNTGLAVRDHEITSDGSLEAAAQLRDLTAEVAAIPDIGEQPLRADTPVPEAIANTDRADLRELNFDSYVAAGALGQQADGSIALLAISVRGASGAAADERPVISDLSQEEANDACPALPEVQSVTTSSDANVRAQNLEATPQEIGNMVHEEVAAAFLGQPGFKVKAGFRETENCKMGSGSRDPPSSMCFMMSATARFAFSTSKQDKWFGVYRYWDAAKQAFVYAKRIYILEVRP